MSAVATPVTAHQSSVAKSSGLGAARVASQPVQLGCGVTCVVGRSPAPAPLPRAHATGNGNVARATGRHLRREVA
eukprot:scaffold6361_cov132-Isochrysis_galbana.AAC.9